MDGYKIIGDAFIWAADQATGDVGSLAFRLSVAGLLAAAGVYKVRHPLIAAAAAADFGVVRHARPHVGYAVGTAELIAAVLLIAWWSPAAATGCALAGVLSVGFCVVVIRALLRGQRFACHCVSSSEEAISVATAMRAVAMVCAVAIGAVGILRGYTLSPATQALQASGLAAALVGAPMALFTCLTVWRRHLRFMHETDWEWVLLGPQRSARPGR